MSFFSRVIARLQKTVKYSASDPKNFEEVWSFQSNAIRLVSLITVIIVGISILAVYLFAGTMSGKKSINRNVLEDQNAQIIELTEKVEAQENYLRYVGLILSGNVPIVTNVDSVKLLTPAALDSLDASLTAPEKELNLEVKEDLSTIMGSDDKTLTFFVPPVKGVVSQKFDAKNHPGVDVVTSKDNTIAACLAGTVIYKGYTRADGNIIIIEHAGGFLTVYKHNKTVLKKVGSKIQRGDPIAIVGNTGENSDGPHLHFELWYEQAPVDPENYISFKR